MYVCMYVSFSACIGRYWGAQCVLNCPTNCGGSTCEKTNGNCNCKC